MKVAISYCSGVDIELVNASKIEYRHHALGTTCYYNGRACSKPHTLIETQKALQNLLTLDIMPIAQREYRKIISLFNGGQDA